MADIRIKDLATQASAPAADDYLELDGATIGSRKISPAALTLPAAATRSVRPSLYSNGATASRRVEFIPGAAGAVAGMPISIPFEFEVPTSNPAASMQLWALGPDATPNNANTIIVGLNTEGTLLVQEVGAAANYSRLTNYVGFRAAYSGQRVMGMVVFGDEIIETTTPPTMYINGVDVSASMTQTTGGTPPNWGHAALNTTLLMMGYNAPAIRWVPHGPILGALTAAEVLAWTQTGQLPTWCQVATGSAVAFLESDFSSSSGWVLVNGASIADGVLNFSPDASTGRAQYTIATVPAGCAVEVRYTIVSNDSVRILRVLDTGQVSSAITATVVALDSTPGTYRTIFVADGASTRVTAGFQLNGALASGSIVVDNISFRVLGPIFTPVVQPGGVVLADSGSNRIPGLQTPGITAIGEKPEHISVLSGQMTADGFVLADQVVTPSGYELVAAYATRIAGTGTGTLTVKETSSGGTTVATAAIAAGTVALTVSNGMLASGKKLHVANSSWDSTTVQLRFVFRRFQ